MKKYISFPICFIIAFLFDYNLIYSQAEYEQWLKEQQKGLETMAEGENNYLAAITQEFDDYLVEQERLYQNFKDEVEKKWDEFRYSSKWTYVDYDKDLDSRASVDFEKGEVEVEVIVEKDPKSTNKELAKKGAEKLKKKLEQIAQVKADDQKPLLKDQLQTSTGEKVTAKNAGSYASETVKKTKVKKQKIKSKDGKTRIKYTVKIRMLPNHLDVRAKRYKDEVIKQSNRFNIDPRVAFAIMHTESSFNPKARSHVPAYGLMQLVPKSGARDAYNYVYKKDKLVRGRYLYKPKNNIELGCAYISKLRHVYFKGVSNDESAYYCTIASYNTGAGNVARSFTGKTKLKPAVKTVNSKSSKDVYKHLKRNLPYKETRDYLVRVTDRISYYESWI